MYCFQRGRCLLFHLQLQVSSHLGLDFRHHPRGQHNLADNKAYWMWHCRLLRFSGSYVAAFVIFVTFSGFAIIALRNIRNFVAIILNVFSMILLALDKR